MDHRRWSRPELLAVLSLYCQTPFGQMHSRNSAVIKLAEVIRRTPSAVALKLVNFASLDPELAARGIGGMANSSSADRSVWTEFYGRWEQLAEASEQFDSATRDSVPVQDELDNRVGPNEATEIERMTMIRLGQQFFRNVVLAAYDWKCCITSISCRELLRASHIVPWAQNTENRLNPRNGLCMNCLHDAAFDRGLITFDPQFKLVVADRIRSEVPADLYDAAFLKYAGCSIRLPERFAPDPRFFETHRTTIFVGTS